jgi:uncharacterized protein (TIGR02246 family)
MLQSKNTATPDDKRSFEHGEISLVNLTGFTVGRADLRPGWKWSADVRPIVGTESCQGVHSSYVVSGRLHIAMNDGRELELTPGDAHLVGPGHDAWVVGDEPCVTIDFIPTGDTVGGRVVRCPCGVEFRVATDDQLGHLVAAVQEHAKGSHHHELTREQVLADVGAAPASAAAAATDDASAVRAVIEAYGDSLRRNDIDALAGLFTADAAVMAGGFPTAVGRARITDTYAAALASADMDYTYEFDQVEVTGDTAVARTSSSGTTTLRSSGETSAGRYRELFVLRREEAGWRISAYTFQPQPQAV